MFFSGPGIAKSFTANAFANSTIRLSWSDLHDGGETLNKIALQYRNPQHKVWSPLLSLFPTASNSASYTANHEIDVSNIMDAGTYRFGLVAHNHHGPGNMTESNPVAICKFHQSKQKYQIVRVCFVCG